MAIISQLHFQAISISVAGTVTLQCHVLLILRVYKVGFVSRSDSIGMVMFPSLGSAAESDCHTLKNNSESAQLCPISGPASDNTVNTLSCGASRTYAIPAPLPYVANCLRDAE